MKRKLFGFLRRAGFLVLVVWTVVSLVTILIELVPGDPAAAVLGDQATPEQLAQFRARHGLDRPPFFFGFPQDTNGRHHFRWYGRDNRYTDYWIGILHGDLGSSFRTDRPVIGPMLVYLFAVKLGWLAPSGRFDWNDIILPAFTLGAALSAILTRMVRSSVIEELNEGYVRTARAKGLSERTVVYKHVLKNGLIPVVTVLGLQLGVLLAGAIITEKIFGWPGLGLLLVEDGIGKRDYSVVQGCVLAISTTYIVANTLTDMMYRWLDPRIRVS